MKEFSVDVPAALAKDPFIGEVVVVLRLLLKAHWPKNAAGYAAAVAALADADVRLRLRLERRGDRRTLTSQREHVLDDLVLTTSSVLASRLKGVL